MLVQFPHNIKSWNNLLSKPDGSEAANFTISCSFYVALMCNKSWAVLHCRMTNWKGLMLNLFWILTWEIIAFSSVCIWRLPNCELSTTIYSLRVCIYICLPVWSRNIFAFYIFDVCSVLLLMLCFVNVLRMQEFTTHFGCMHVMLIKWIRYWDNNLWSFTACLFLIMYATGTIVSTYS